MEIEYLTQEELNGFDRYKYSCKDAGILSIYVMHPFWNWLVQYCPKWIAPNLLTFSGFLFTVLMYLMFALMDYSFYASDLEHPDYPPVPNWAFIAAALFLFLAYTLDGIDGKQARRTGTSGPLGELFDHGLDSFSAGLIPVATYTIFGRGGPYTLGPFRMFFIVWNVLINFYLSHWEKYNTGVLFLPWGYDFSMWGTIAAFLFAGLAGYEKWQFELPGGLTTGVMFEIVLYGSAITTNIPVVLYNIYKSYRDKTGYMRTFSEAIRPLLSVTIFFLVTVYWIIKSPSNIIERDPRIVFLILSTVFSNISCRLIVAQMSSTRCEVFNLLLLPTFLTIFLSIWSQSIILELFLTYSLSIFTTLAHFHYGTFLVRQMCRHFHIDCFRIKKPSD